MENKYLKAVIEFMRVHKLDQKQMAQRLEVTPAAVSHWLSGTDNIRKANMAKIAFICKDFLPDDGSVIVQSKSHTPVDPLTDAFIVIWRKLNEDQRIKMIGIASGELNKEAATVTQPGEPKHTKNRPGFHGTQNKSRGIPLMILQQAIGE